MDAGLIAALEGIVGRAGVVATPEGRLTYECDMHTFYKGAPDVVVLPTSAAQTAAVVRLCREKRVPLIPRGSGTGLIGGAMAPRGGVMGSMTGVNRILAVGIPNRWPTVGTGAIGSPST